MILTKTTHNFLYFTANTWYNSAKPTLIHQGGGSLVDGKLSLSRVKIVQHGPLTLFPTTRHTTFFLLLFASLLYSTMRCFIIEWLHQCISLVGIYQYILGDSSFAKTKHIDYFSYIRYQNYMV